MSSPEVTMMRHLLRGEIGEFMATSEAVGPEHTAGIDAIFAAAVARSAAPADRLVAAFGPEIDPALAAALLADPAAPAIGVDALRTKVLLTVAIARGGQLEPEALLP
jgi:hypothetical protein